MARTSLLLLVFLVFFLLHQHRFCQADNPKIEVFELKRGDFSIKATNYGATLLSVILPDKNGKLGDVALGFDSVDDYKTDDTYFGAIVGRVANRIGGAQFTLNGTTYKLVPNDHGKNTLHGGSKGFGDVVWSVYSYKPRSHVTFTYDSFDGEQGFPGEVKVSVTYMLLANNKLAIKMTGEPQNKPTPVNMAFHGYWNLGGHTSGDILSHIVQIYGSNITPVDKDLFPTGELTPVKDTPYDFLQPHPINKLFDQLPNGYDINYVLNEPKTGHLSKAAMVHDSVSGRKMELWTNKPGLQFYTGNFLKSVKGKGGFVYHQHAALCLESQGFPDSVNNPNFPSQIVSPGEVYEHVMLYRFTVA